jgi:phosphatidylglycerol lysyltransferase
METTVTLLADKLKSFVARSDWREVLAILMLLLAFLFFRTERKELHDIIPHIRRANPFYLACCFIVFSFYIAMQGGTYRMSFAVFGVSLSLLKSIDLFLKRNMLSVFLPAGGFTALAYTPSAIRKSGIGKVQIQQGSALFAFAGLVTVFLIGLPVLVTNMVTVREFKNAWIGLLLVLLLIISLLLIGISLKRKSTLYQIIRSKFPSLSNTVDEVLHTSVDRKKFASAILCSVLVDICGIVHLYLAMLALGIVPSLAASATAYIISILLMVVSPFLRGLGAVEAAIVYSLALFGFTAVQALAITVLYRVFEFWLPFLAGFIAFAWKGKSFFLRTVPILFTFLLGFANVISAVSAPTAQRLYLLREYIPLTAIHASQILVLFVGLALLATAAFLFQGLRSAWVIAISLSVISLIAHLSKALDYKASCLAAITILILAVTSGQYRIRASRRFMRTGVKVAMLSFVSALVFGWISFYFIDKRHFGIDFTWQQSILHTVETFFLIQDVSLHPITKFGNEFVSLIRMVGFFTWGFLLFTIRKPHFKKRLPDNDYNEKVTSLLARFGSSSTDYFKVYKDKSYFFSNTYESFIAYRVAGSFAIVLEEPVCAHENKKMVIAEFNKSCHKLGLKPVFYRVNESSIDLFSQLTKNKLLIGQEAILELKNFHLVGKRNKRFRNGLSSLNKKGYTVEVHPAPHAESFLLRLRAVSEDWLNSFSIKELVFSQGMFDEDELREQDIITLTDTAGNIKAFLNIIPDYGGDECTYDLIRKTTDAPGSAMDAMIIRLVQYAKDKGQLYLNLGMVPMTGIDHPENIAERVIKFAAKRIKRFHHYQGLREFKEKYATYWENKYLIYENDFDLLQLPAALSNVMKP